MAASFCSSVCYAGANYMVEVSDEAKINCSGGLNKHISRQMAEHRSDIALVTITTLNCHQNVAWP